MPTVTVRALDRYFPHGGKTYRRGDEFEMRARDVPRAVSQKSVERVLALTPRTPVVAPIPKVVVVDEFEITDLGDLEALSKPSEPAEDSVVADEGDRPADGNLDGETDDSAGTVERRQPRRRRRKRKSDAADAMSEGDGDGS
jgi:hypothetical protein